LKAFIVDAEQTMIERIPTESMEAYELLKQAEYLLRIKGVNELLQAIEIALEAIKIDPEYADAYAWVGFGILLKGSHGGLSPMLDVVFDALPYIIKARDLDPNLSYAHTVMGIYYLWTVWDYISAEQEYLRAMELEPNNGLNVGQYLEFLNKMDRPKDVLSLKGLPATSTDLIKTYIISGNRAETENHIAIYFDSVGYKGDPYVGECYLWMEEFDSARVHLESALQSENLIMLVPRFQACLAFAYYKTNQMQQAQVIIDQLIEQFNITSAMSPDFYIGWYYSGIGEVDSAFYWLEKAYNNRSQEFPWLKVDPAFNNLKEYERYWDLYERTGHKAYDDYIAGKNK